MEKIDIGKIRGFNFIRELLNVMDKRWGECYLVGGTIRDYYLNRVSCDLDFVVPWKEDLLARRFANSIKGKFFLLGSDGERVARVVLKQKEMMWKFDFTTFRGEDLYDDLEKRDFTINALAVSIFDGRLIDIFDGISDIRDRIIRPITKKVFLDDPLRILRAFRFSYSLSFEISDIIYELIEIYRPLLKKISGERIRDEFFEILKTQDFPTALFELSEKKVLKVLFPSLLYDYKMFHRIKIFIERDLRRDFFNYSDKVISYLYRETSVSRRKLEILKIALLFLFLLRDNYMNYLDLLKLTRQEIKIIDSIILKTREFLNGKIPTLSYLFSFPIYIQDELPGIAILLYIFDKISISYQILNIYYEKLLPGRVLPRFIDGNILKEKWGIPSGPLIKEILDKVRIAQIEGKVNTKEEAYSFIDNILKH